ncbi:tubulointerstitial nephritis antigen-like isoform X2 [Amphiura filiformis]|uniref:tubulointerstitial nephritis antigen-like isoform X2 n=1 Tax=Amphiura filiformis TaxID=82378 RepID=UPI003B2103E0
MNLVLFWMLRTWTRYEMKYYLVFVSLMSLAMQLQTADAVGFYYKRNGVCRNELYGGVVYPTGTTFYYKCQKCFCFETFFGPVAGCQDRVCPKGYCWHKGKGFAEGFDIHLDCNRCTCSGSVWSCSRRDCDKENFRFRLGNY